MPASQVGSGFARQLRSYQHAYPADAYRAVVGEAKHRLEHYVDVFCKVGPGPLQLDRASLQCASWARDGAADAAGAADACLRMMPPPAPGLRAPRRCTPPAGRASSSPAPPTAWAARAARPSGTRRWDGTCAAASPTSPQASFTCRTSRGARRGCSALGGRLLAAVERRRVVVAACSDAAALCSDQLQRLAAPHPCACCCRCCRCGCRVYVALVQRGRPGGRYLVAGEPMLASEFFALYFQVAGKEVPAGACGCWLRLAASWHLVITCVSDQRLLQQRTAPMRPASVAAPCRSARLPGPPAGVRRQCDKGGAGHQLQPHSRQQPARHRPAAAQPRPAGQQPAVAGWLARGSRPHSCSWLLLSPIDSPIATTRTQVIWLPL